MMDAGLPLSKAMLPIPEAPTDNEHYIRAVTDMADQCTVVAQKSIYTDNQIKLVEKGTRIDSRLYNRLVQHKLSAAIDTHLTVENAVDVSDLVAAAKAQCETRSLPKLLVQALGGANGLLAPLGAVILPAPIAFKLTVVREQHPALYAHSIQMVLLAVFLGLRNEMNERDCIGLATAALLHDLGSLYMGPPWRDPAYKAEGVERTHLMAHPVTAMLVIRAQPEYAPAIEIAVLEHHERMDGSGYPRGLPGEKISPMGRILLLCEVVVAFYEKYTEAPAQRLSVVLRLNHRKFPADLVGHVLGLLHDANLQDPALLALSKDALLHIHVLEQAFEQWATLRANLPSFPPSATITNACTFLDTHLAALEKILLEAGAHPRQQAEMAELLQSDAQGLTEVALVGREARWQLQAIVHGCQRRWPQSSERSDAAVAQWSDWVQAQT